jgi:hypothetical protein
MISPRAPLLQPIALLLEILRIQDKEALKKLALNLLDREAGRRHYGYGMIGPMPGQNAGWHQP